MHLIKSLLADRKHVFVLLVVFLTARLLFMWLMPYTFSYDLHAWIRVIGILDRGGNPYAETGSLNWPPFWMQTLYGIHLVSKIVAISEVRLIQALLVMTEGCVMLMAYGVTKQFFNPKNTFSIFLFGMALNPMPILLNCQHCNFDVFVGFWIIAFAWQMLEYNQNGNTVHWLLAAFFLGMGILTKTVPLVLTPVLLLGIRSRSWGTNLFGCLLVFTPVIIGMSIIFTLANEGVKTHVLGYRSMAGWYGITGLLHEFDLERAVDTYQEFSPYLFSGLLAFTAWRMYKTASVKPETLILILLIILLFIPTLGPGYTPPYLLWYFPLLIIAYAFCGDKLRKLLLAGYIIVGCTYLTEYALFLSHGSFLNHMISSERFAALSEMISGSKKQVLVRIPMFLFYCILFFTLISTLSKDNKNLAAKQNG